MSKVFVFSALGEMRVEKMTAVQDVLAWSCRGNGELKERNRFMPLMSQKSSLAALRSFRGCKIILQPGAIKQLLLIQPRKSREVQAVSKHALC